MGSLCAEHNIGYQRMPQRYDFTIISDEVRTSVADMQSFLQKYDADTGSQTRVKDLAAKFANRFDAINVNTPKIDGKSTNPFVLSAFARTQSIAKVAELDQLIAAAKMFSSLETALGRVVEDVVPSSYGWSQVHSPGHSVLSEIDSAKVDLLTSTVKLAALKSGPSCINDSMVSQIANAIATNWEAWADKWNVENVHYIVGMNYSTGKNSNKKDWHIVRLAEEKVAAKGANVSQSCIRQIQVRGKSKPQALTNFIASNGQKNLTVEVRQGKGFWTAVGGIRTDTFFEVCAALSLALTNLDSSPVPVNPTTGGLDEVVRRAEGLSSQAMSDGELQWFALFVRHFVDSVDA